MAVAGAVIGAIFSITSAVISMRKMKKMNKTPKRTYSDSMATETSNTMPIPIIYGRVKSAGNLIYSKLSDDKTVMKKLIVFCDGKIQGITDIRLDDIPINSDKLSGASWNTYVGDGEQLIDSRVEGNTNEERAKVVGGLKYDAYVALQAQANDNISGNFNVTAIVEGSIVKVYSSPTEYTEQWSNNPAWCVLDFLTRYNGVGLSTDEIDIDSFIEGSKFYDQKNYTLNITLDEKMSRLEWVSTMLNCCRSSLVYRNGKYSLFIEKPEPVVQFFTPDSINNLELWWSEMEDIPDRVYVQYIDPDFEWAKVNAQAEAENPLRKQLRTETYELYGVTNFDQASRLAWFYLNQAITCPMFCKFTTDRRGLDRTVGDVIALSDYITEFKEKRFRVLKITDKQDDSIEITCREYNENIYNEQKGDAEPTYNITDLQDPTAPPPSIEYVSNEQDYYLMSDKTPVSLIKLYYTFDEYQYSRNVLIWYRKVGDKDWLFGGDFSTETKSATIKGVEIQKSYEFRFVHESRNGKRSDYSYSPSIYITGKDRKPPNVIKLNTDQLPGGTRRFWWDFNYPTPNDIAGFKLKYTQGNNPNWNDAFELHSGVVTAQPFETQALRQGVHTVMIKAVDNADNESEEAVYTVINLGDLLEDNVLWKKDFSEENWKNIETDGVVVDNQIWGSGEDKELNLSVHFQPLAHGQFWLEYIIDSPATVQYCVGSGSLAWSKPTDSAWSSSTDAYWKFVGIYKPYTGKVLLNASDAIHLKINCKPDKGQVAKIEKLIAYVDVPDRVENFEDITIPEDGIVLPIKTPYYSTTAVRVNAIQTVLRGQYELEIMSKNPCKIRFLKINNDAAKSKTPIEVNADITWQGFQKEVIA